MVFYSVSTVSTGYKDFKWKPRYTLKNFQFIFTSILILLKKKQNIRI